MLIKVCHKLVEQEQPGYNLQIKKHNQGQSLGPEAHATGEQA